MFARIEFYLDRIPPTADLSLALPDEALRRLDVIEREIEQCERDRLAEAQEAERAAQISWARLSSMMSRVGARSDPYQPRPMPTPDARSKPWLQFARRLAQVRQTMKPLTFHLLIPLKPETEAQARVIGPDVASILDRRVDNVRALQDAAASADTFLRLSDELPYGWPNLQAIQRGLALEAVGALELAGRIAAFRDQNSKAAEFRMRAAELCHKHGQSERCDSNVISRVWAGIAAGEPAGEMLAKLDFPFGRPLFWEPVRLNFQSLIESKSLKPFPSFQVGSSWPMHQAHDYGPATTLLGAEARVVRARLHQTLGEGEEARRLLEEAKACLEPTGQVRYPARETFVATMMQAMLLQKDGKPYFAEIENLTTLTRQRALAMSYCETAALAFSDVSKQKFRRYKRAAEEIALM